jgi:hypothetical protein
MKLLPSIPNALASFFTGSSRCTNKMTTKAKATSRAVARSGERKTQGELLAAPPLTMEERLHRIEAMGRRIDDYIKFMCGIVGPTGTSAEAKERAVAAFHEQLVVVESQLARIHDELRLE